MEKIIDLHTHSTASDGSMSPEELVRHAKAIGLSAIALTDHDTVDGIEEAIKEGKRSGVEVIPGIEISVRYKPEMHILGLFPDGDKYLNIRSELSVVKKGRQERNRKIINRLNELGIEITEDDVRNVAMGDITGRPHIARVLVAKGYVKTIDEAFEIYLSKEGLAYFQRFELEPVDGIKAI